MPRLNHKKTRSGCQRCKARKVKCDEGRPKCSACYRHNVSCEYVEPAPRRSEQQQQHAASHHQQPDQYQYQVGAAPDADVFTLDPRLEIRLMHQWTAHTCQTFSADDEFWRCQMPVFAIENRMVLDAMFGLAALHASRQSSQLDGRILRLQDPAKKVPANDWKPSDDDGGIASAIRDANSNADPLAEGRSREMLLHARKYFDRAAHAHHGAIANLTKDNIESVYITSILVSFQAVFSLSDPDEPSLPPVDPIAWFRLADGTHYLCEVWQQLVGDEWLDSAGIFFGRPKSQEAEALFATEQGKPFEALLAFTEEFETSPEDRAVYHQAVAVLAFIYNSITDNTDAPVSNCRRLVAMPSQLPRRFTELIDLKQPRALAILAYTFAVMQILSEQVFWFRGIADRQVPNLATQVPPNWSDVMKWPMEIAGENRQIRPNEEQQLTEVLAL